MCMKSVVPASTSVEVDSPSVEVDNPSMVLYSPSALACPDLGENGQDLIVS